MCKLEKFTNAVTLPILQRQAGRDEVLQQLVEDIKSGKVRKELEI